MKRLDPPNLGGDDIIRYLYRLTQDINDNMDEFERDRAGMPDNGPESGPEIVRQNVSIYNVRGKLMDSTAGTIEGFGDATVSVYGNGIARIDFSIKITKSPAEEDYKYGLNRDLFTGCPLITPASGGSCTFYKPDGTINTDREGYAGVMDPSDSTWIPARVYEESGATGRWSAHLFDAGSKIVGTCYGHI